VEEREKDFCIVILGIGRGGMVSTDFYLSDDKMTPNKTSLMAFYDIF